MKNKTLKNLIALSIFAVSIFSVNSASAFVYYNNPSYGGYDNTSYVNVNNDLTSRQQIIEQQYAYQQRQLQLENQIAQQQYYNDQQKLIQQQNLVTQQQNITNASNAQVAQSNTQTITYVPQQQTVQYVPNPTVNYVPASNQGASAYNSIASNKVNTTSGKYVNYDSNLQAASAYGYNNGAAVGQTYDPNSVTALSLNGSGGFLPTSIFQWFMLILLILAIIIVARIIAKKSHSTDPHAVVTH